LKNSVAMAWDGKDRRHGRSADELRGNLRQLEAEWGGQRKDEAREPKRKKRDNDEERNARVEVTLERLKRQERQTPALSRGRRRRRSGP
jgi:hypothetical protein